MTIAFNIGLKLFRKPKFISFDMVANLLLIVSEVCQTNFTTWVEWCPESQFVIAVCILLECPLRQSNGVQNPNS
jgi:hypothetical protein